ncbi:MAG: hypothetical protein GY864_03245 [Desulfobacterales bacterium]|nr:hypothetical protein [Desulfobacterales bacterium]
MLNKILNGTILLTLALSPVIASAQNTPSGKWWQFQIVSKQLRLNSHEKQKLNKLFSNNRYKLIELKMRVEKEQFGLENTLEKDDTNKTEAMKQWQRLEDARARLAAERFRYLLNVRTTLGNQRFQKLKILFQESRNKNKLTHPKNKRPLVDPLR